MQKIFQEYGGVITTAMVIVALVSLIGIFFTADGDGWMDNAFHDVVDGFVGKVDEAVPGEGTGGSGGSGGGNGDGSSLPAVGTSAEDCTWDEIKAISEAGKGDEYFDLGDEKTITLIDGTEVVMQIVAFNADTLASDATQTAGITWVSKGIITTHAMNSAATNTNGWAASDMRTWLQSDFYDTLPDDVKSVIVSVNKTYYDRTTSSTLTCTDNVWIPSHREIFGDDAYESSGADYTAFFTDASARIKYNSSNTAIAWWMRSAYTQGTTPGFRTVGADGGSKYLGATYPSFGAVLGFCS